MRGLLRWLVASRNGRVVLAVLVALAIPLGWLAWWLGSPLFIDKTVEEDFPLAATAQITGMTLTPPAIRELTRGVPEDEVAAIIDQMADDVPSVTDDTPLVVTMTGVEAMMEARAGIEEVTSESMPRDEGRAGVALLSGEFRDADSFHRGSGTTTVYELPDGSRLLRVEDLRVTNGPDLRVLLSVHPDPTTQSQIKDQGYVELAKLKGNIGNQNYEIPPDVDVSIYNSVVIYCKPFHVLFSVAPLR